jgi:cob(I)alamin adenosyltransferase
MSERGDKGLTEGECLLTVSKDSPFVEAVGAIDEFQSRLGLARVLLEEKKENRKIYEIEKDLHEVMGSLYTGQNWKNGERRVEEIKNDGDEYKKIVRDRVGNLEDFLFPGENELEARLNGCRTGCRTAERRIKTLQIEREEKEDLEMDKNILSYFNRLSYFLNWMWRSKF